MIQSLSWYSKSRRIQHVMISNTCSSIKHIVAFVSLVLSYICNGVIHIIVWVFTTTVWFLDKPYKQQKKCLYLWFFNIQVSYRCMLHDVCFKLLIYWWCSSLAIKHSTYLMKCQMIVFYYFRRVQGVVRKRTIAIILSKSRFCCHGFWLLKKCSVCKGEAEGAIFVVYKLYNQIKNHSCHYFVEISVI